MDCYIVEEFGISELIYWGFVNCFFLVDKFDVLWSWVVEYVFYDDQFIFNLYVGVDVDYYIVVKVIIQIVWYNLFGCCLFIIFEKWNLKIKEFWEILYVFIFECDFECDGINSDGCVIFNFVVCKVLIVGMCYVGEMKKVMFFV